MSTYAGFFDEAQIDPVTELLVKDVLVTIQKPDTTLANIWEDKERTSPLGNPYPTDEDGNLTFYADPGDYYLLFPGRINPHHIVVNAHPLEPSITGSGVVHTTGDESIDGVKTFTVPPVVPNASFAEAAVVGLSADLTSIRNRASARGTVVDIVADYGADPTGAVSATAAFASANADLVALGGGVIVCPPGLYLANLNLSVLVNIIGYGVYASRIQGVTGAGVPVVKKDCYAGDFVMRLGIYGTHPWDGTTPGGNGDPETGLYLWRSGAWWASTTVEDVKVALARGLGIADYIQGAWFNRIEGSYCGGRIFDQAGGSTDTFVSESIFSASFLNERLVNAVGLAGHWRNVKANVAGIHWDIPTLSWRGDNANTTAVGFAIGTDVDMVGAISEDNPIGFQFFGDGCSVRGLSAGDHVPVSMQLLDSANDANCIVELEVRCNDRFVPAKGASLVNNFKGRITLNIDWESSSASGPMAEAGKIKDKVGFKVFDDQSAGFGALYNSNRYDVRDDGAGAFWDSAGGDLTPDLINGTQYYVATNGDIAVNNFVHRSGLNWGKRLRFVFDAGATAGRKITFGTGYNLPQRVVTLPAGQTVMEFTQTSPSFSPTWKLTSKSPSGVRFVEQKYTGGNITLNQAATTTWANVPGVSTLVLSNCAVGDKVTVTLSALWNNEGNLPVMDVASEVSGVLQNYWGTAGGGTDDGVLAWAAAPSGTFVALGGSISKTLVASDIAADGTVTLRLRYRMQSAGVNKTLFANANVPFYWSAEDKGLVIV